MREIKKYSVTKLFFWSGVSSIEFDNFCRLWFRLCFSRECSTQEIGFVIRFANYINLVWICGIDIIVIMSDIIRHE